jgi:hypothetical protein
VTCDVPSHCFQYTFANNPNWTHFFSPGQEIGEYFKNVAERYKVPKYVKFEHMFKSAQWIEEDAQWEITILRMSDQLVSIELEHVLRRQTLTVVTRNSKTDAMCLSKQLGCLTNGHGRNSQV